MIRRMVNWMRNSKAKNPYSRFSKTMRPSPRQACSGPKRIGYIIRKKRCVQVVLKKGKNGRMRRMVRRKGKFVKLRKGKRVYKSKAAAKKSMT